MGGSWKTYAAIFAVMAVWGSMHPITKLLMADLGPTTVAFFRILFSLLFFAPALHFSKIGFEGMGRHWKAILAASFLGIACSMLFLTYGLQRSTASASSVLMNANPLFVALFAVIIDRKWHGVSPRVALGLLAGFAGIALIFGESLLPSLSSKEYLAGNLLFLLSAASAAAFTLIYSRFIAGKMNPVAAQAAMSAASLPVLLAIFLLSGEQPSFGAFSLAALLYLGVVVAGFCWSYFLKAVDSIGAVGASAFKLLIPVSGVLLSAAFLGEELRPVFIAGAALVLAGLYAVAARKETPAAA